ncbi:hypothetical protein [Kordia zhangzhouensis]|uniref:hypothetical protein n=1 Tax=Kordia zhangzhouensis TaxID=1620405 RepID=UPI00062934D4|nr:hypothetical protein [Kordia zhangzhouensis]
MNEFRRQHLIDRKKSIEELFEKIKDNPNPEIIDLWMLDEEHFIKWRQIHDFPKLLKHFDSNLLLFKEWKQDQNLTDKIIIESGELTPFLERKRWSKKRKLFLTKQTCNGVIRNVVSYTKLEGKKQYLGQEFHFEPISEFYSYLDWLQRRQKSENILYINSRTAPGFDSESVSIHADVYSSSKDFELLKMGGIDIPVNGFGILMRGKRLEFVNLCGLRLQGRISFGEEGNLSCSYCACDNMTASELDMALLNFSHCSMNNFQINNSKIQQWQFYDCRLNGDFTNNEFRNIDVIGGLFTPVVNGCTFLDVNVHEDKAIENHNLYAYQLLKKSYVEQGDDDSGIKYFVKEHDFKRRKLKGWKFIGKTISALYWGYGRKPQRIIWTSLVMILGNYILVLPK